MQLEQHYPTERWADYARGLVDMGEREQMEGHLTLGCLECGREARVLGHMSHVAAREARYAPPRSVTRRALSVFRPRDREPGVISKILARLVYDSMLDPLPAGVRAQDRPQQALYEADGFAVDLHLNRETGRRERGASQMVLVGQITDRRAPERRLARRPVMLRSGREISACGMSNELGEFHLAFSPARDLTLEIPVDDTRVVEVNLPAASTEGV